MLKPQFHLPLILYRRSQFSKISVRFLHEASYRSPGRDFRKSRPHREPPGYVRSDRWLTQRPPDNRIQSVIFKNQEKSVVSDVEATYLAANIDAQLSGIPVTDDFSYQVVDNISSIPLVDHRLYENLCHMGIEQLTPVQRHAIGIMSVDEQAPMNETNTEVQRVVGKYDLMAAAQTGSGKTLAYLIPIINRLLRVYPFEAMQDKLAHVHCQFPSGLVLVPTRELAQQIFDEAMKLCYRTFLRPVTLYGGERPSRQLYELSMGGHLIVATPGRLLDFLRQNALRLNHCRSLILDEADRMLDMGFEEQIREVIESREFNMPRSKDIERQTCLFSATFPREVALMARNFLRGSQCISLTIGDAESGSVVPEWGQVARKGGSGASRLKDELNRLTRIVPREIDQRFEYVDDRSTEVLYQHLTSLVQSITSGAVRGEATEQGSIPLPTDKVHRVLIFCNTKSEVDQVDGALYRSGLKSAGLHGDKSQAHRSKALDWFRRGKIQVLAASSVAARGLDIPHVTAVINVGFPVEVEDYVHRIGRTGRMGRSGMAITLLNPNLLDRASRSVAHGVVQLFRSTIKGADSKGKTSTIPEVVLQFARLGDPNDRARSNYRSKNRSGQFRTSKSWNRGFSFPRYRDDGRDGDTFRGSSTGGRFDRRSSGRSDELNRRYD